jgi:SHS2 domain-containing protein
MAHRVLSHTADTGVEATADSLAELIHELAEGMFESVARLDRTEAKQWVEVTVESPTVEDLVVDTLAELIYQSEAEDLLFCAFRVKTAPNASRASVEAGGVPMSRVEPSGPAIKAVTYHRLIVDETDGHWYGRVYLDV